MTRQTNLYHRKGELHPSREIWQTRLWENSVLQKTRPNGPFVSIVENFANVFELISAFFPRRVWRFEVHILIYSSPECTDSGTELVVVIMSVYLLSLSVYIFSLQIS